MITSILYFIMVEFFLEPFTVGFVWRALLAAVLAALMSAMIGVWIVVRGMTFLGEAMSHGMLPGVALAALLGGNIIVGATLSALFMSLSTGFIRNNPRISSDTGIGLLYAGMLSLGVIIVSQSKSFAVDLTGFLFGDVLAATESDLWYLATVFVIVLLVTTLMYRPFLALSFDSRKAETLGLAPRAASLILMVLLTLAIAASFHVVGTLLAFAILIAPAATGVLIAGSMRTAALFAAISGILSSYLGLLISWHLGTAAGPSIALIAVLMFFSVLTARALGSGLGGVLAAKRGKNSEAMTL